MFSFQQSIGTALVTVLNGDPKIQEAGFSFVYRKKPYNAGYDWRNGAFVCPLDYDAREHENTRDLYPYPFVAVIAKQAEGELTAGSQLMSGTIERIYSILHNKSGGFAPATLRALDTSFATAAAAGDIAGAAFHRVTTRRSQMFIDAVFQKGYDVCACIVEVEVLQLRPNSSSL